MDIVTSSIRDRTSAGEYRGGLGQSSSEEEEEDILAQEEEEAEATDLTDPQPASRIKMSLASPRLCLPSSADGPTLLLMLLLLSMLTDADADADGGTAGEWGALLSSAHRAWCRSLFFGF